MPGVGTAPKPPEERRNRNSKQRGEWIDLPAEGTFELVLPELPATDPDGDPWPASTRRLWEAWREDPASSQFSKADVAFAIDTIELHACMRVTDQAELRQRMDRLGFTPKGKRDLRYRLPQYVEAQEEAEQKKQAHKKGTARRARLSLVED